MAGLPASRAIVRVGPPLLPSGASNGSSGLEALPDNSPEPVAPKPLLPSIAPIRLWPREVIGAYAASLA